MPELPEVETVRRSLQDRTVGARIVALNVYFDGCIHNLTPQELSKRLIDRRIQQWQRQGKYLVMLFDDGACMTVHLRMTGQLLLVIDEADQVGTYTRLTITLDGNRLLRFDDQRKFGRVTWYPHEQALHDSLVLGPDPTSDDFRPDDLAALLAGRRRPIKSLLLDQSVLAGVGNIYADEALFRAGLLPTRPVNQIDPDEIKALWLHLRDVLHEGIAHRGTSMRDYVDSDGRVGEFQKRLRVYGREGQPCVSCGRALDRIKVAGRSSFHCVHCQT